MQLTPLNENEIVIKVVGASRHYIRLEVGAFDPERWETKGDIGFGMGVEIMVSELGFGQDGYEAGVSIGGIGSHNAETARLRIDAYKLAADIAADLDWHANRLEDGQTLEDIHHLLDADWLEHEYDAPVLRAP